MLINFTFSYVYFSDHFIMGRSLQKRSAFCKQYCMFWGSIDEDKFRKSCKSKNGSGLTQKTSADLRREIWPAFHELFLTPSAETLCFSYQAALGIFRLKLLARFDFCFSYQIGTVLIFFKHVSLYSKVFFFPFPFFLPIISFCFFRVPQSVHGKYAKFTFFVIKSALFSDACQIFLWDLSHCVKSYP